MTAFTNFAALTDEQLTVWQRRVWRAARHKMFINRFVGTDEDAMIHRITELKKDEKGARAVITLVHDLEGDGVAGDRFLEGNEEAMTSSDQVIQIDMLRNAVRSKGRMAEQRSVVQFRQQAENNLSYWLADRWDQMAFLTLSGVSYAFHTNGMPRGSNNGRPSDLPLLDFAGDVSAPTANRHFRWDDTTGIEPGDTSAVAAGDVPTYDMLVLIKALMHDNFVRPIRTVNGVEWYNVFMTPQGIAHLKLDDRFLKAYREAQPRSPNHPLFKGTDVIWLDGLAIHQYRHVYNTKRALDGEKWGGGSVDGQRVIIAGAQALGMADIGRAFWDEKKFDFNNQPAISVGKIGGLLKPKFRAVNHDTVEDYGVTVLDTAI